MVAQLFFALILFGSISRALTQLKSLPEAGKVEFEAIGKNSLLKISGFGAGATADLKVNGKKISGEVIFTLESLKTGIDIRDEEMKEKYLQTKTYPEAKITFNEFEMPSGWSLQNPKIATSSFRGKLKLHGVEREITGLYSVNSDLKATAKFDVKLTDFSIEIPVYLGIKVADFIKINVTMDKMFIVK